MLSFVLCFSENQIPYKPGKFESQIKDINDRFGRLSEQLTSVHKDAKARVNSLRSVVHVVDSNWQQLVKSGDIKSIASEKFVNADSGISETDINNKNNNKTSNAIDLLNTHLEIS